jgi:hypothetical protein
LVDEAMAWEVDVDVAVAAVADGSIIAADNGVWICVDTLCAVECDAFNSKRFPPPNTN